MIKILTVEDNEISRKNLCKVLEDNIENVEIYEAANGEKAIEILNEHRIDIFFLDIMLPDMSGLKIAEHIRSIDHYELTYIIFITTHLVYLPKALQEYHCYDFIEKPFSKERILEITDRLVRGMNPKQTLAQKERFVSIQTKNVLNKVQLDDIYFVEIYGRKLKVHTTMGVLEVYNISLKNMIDKIELICSDCFIKSHRSYYINLKHVSHINRLRKRSWEVVFTDYEGTALVGEMYSDEVFSRLG